MTHKGPISPPPLDLHASVARAHRPVPAVGPAVAAPAQARMAPGPLRPAGPNFADRRPPGRPPPVFAPANGVPVQRKRGATTVGPPPLAWSGARSTAVQRMEAPVDESAKTRPFAITFSNGLGLKQVPNADVKAANGWAGAISCLEKVILLLEGQPLESDDEKLFDICFSCHSQEGGATVLRVLKATLEGLKTVDITLNIATFCSGRSNGKILTLASAQMNNDNQRIRYIIHEATHIFAGTLDPGGYIKNDWSYDRGRPRKDAALNNADSFACFVVGCLDISLK